MPDTAGAVERCGAAVYRLAYAMARSRCDADDIFQEVFLRCHRSAPPFATPEHEKAWLLRVAVNGCKSRLRSPWRRLRSPLLESFPAATAEEVGVLEAVQALPAKDRAAIHLFYYEGYQAAEIGQILGLPTATVHTRLARGRAKLRELLGGYGYEQTV